MRYLVDTNKVIDFLHGEEQVREELRDPFQEGVAISAITAGEIFHGIYRHSESSYRLIREFESFLAENGASVLAVDREVAQTFGKIQATLSRSGKIGSPLDMLIAATAMVHDLVLLTDNKRDFRRVRGLHLA